MPTPPSNLPEAPVAHPALYRAVVRTAWVAGVFLVVVLSAMAVHRYQAKSDDPLKSAALAALKERLLANPKDEALKEELRALDLRLRQRYFEQLTFNRMGSWLALGAAVLFLWAGHRARRSHRNLPRPQPDPHRPERLNHHRRQARWAVGVLGLTVILTMTILAARDKTPLPREFAEVERLLAVNPNPEAGPKDFADPSEMRKNWPRFRGADGNGIALQTNLPLAWDGQAGVAWKAEVPVAGFGSPIIWNDRIYLSGGDEARREVLCYDAEKGALLWRQPLPNPSASSEERPPIPEQTGYAAATMATDGRRVYAIFANGDLAAFTLDGRSVWNKHLGFFKNPHGHATSLLTWEGRLIVQADQGEPEQKASKLTAFDGATGRVIWQRTRAVPASWATPIALEGAGQTQIITLAVPSIVAYSAKDGAEMWRVEGLANEVTPSPVFAGGLVYAISPNDRLMAIRPDGQGEVTKSHVVWSTEENVPDIASPLCNGEFVFTLTTPGLLTCFHAKDGQKQWEHDFELECNASLTLANGRLYVIGIKGELIAVQAGSSFQQLARGELGESIFASPAFAGNRVILRGMKHLFCLGGSGSPLAQRP